MGMYTYVEFEDESLPFILEAKKLLDKSGDKKLYFQTKDWMNELDSLVVTKSGSIIWRRAIYTPTPESELPPKTGTLLDLAGILSIKEYTNTLLDLPSEDVLHVYTSMYLTESKEFGNVEIDVIIKNKRVVEFKWEISARNFGKGTQRNLSSGTFCIC